MSVSQIVLPVEDETKKQTFQRKLLNWFERQPASESVLIILTALLVGIGAGLGAVAFRWLIHFFQNLAYSDIGGLLAPIAPYHLLIIPALGGLIVGPIIYRFAREAKGHGVPEVMEAVALRGGKIRPRVAFVKAITSAICIGTGGSAGSEGPIAQIGSAIGSTIGQWLKLSDEQVRNLVACGAGGGIAAIFNAPIAGAIFAIEVVLGRLNTVNFGAVVISAVTADVISNIFEGNNAAFIVPQYTLVNPWELGLYAIMGILLAVASVGYNRLLYFVEDLFDNMHFLPEYTKPAIGGLLLGILGIISIKIDGFPRVFGVGYETITDVLFGNIAFQFLILLFVLKLLATVFTLGSGNSGGVFAPSLFMGAMLGGLFGMVANQFFPDITAPSGAYALVGMAAFFSGSAHAPITAILILFEMTGDYHIILPLMLTTVISTLVSRIIDKDSIYTLKLSRRGIHLEAGQDIDVMQGVSVQEIMTTSFETVNPEMSLIELSEIFSTSHHHGFAVMNPENQLIGMVSITDLDQALLNGPIEELTVIDIATKQGLLVAYPDEPMWKALKRIGSRNISRLPVVEGPGSRQLVGIIYERDIIRAYNHAIAKRAQKQHKMETLQLGKLNDANFSEIEIPKNSSVIGKQVRQLRLPESCLIVSIRRGRKLHIADGFTVLQAGDKVTAFTTHECHSSLHANLTTIVSTLENKETSQEARHAIITIPASAAVIGKMIQEMTFPPDIIIVNIQRKDKVIIPHGNTKILVDDIIEIFGLEHEIMEATLMLTTNLID
ncbi:MAG: chloride channel protein [Anaerolineaceae bacterium]|nr:chloride channel protein [Anaerolineaceae bacterium]